MRPSPKINVPRSAAVQEAQTLSKTQRLLVWLRKAFTENAALKFVAFVLALTIFVLVHSDNDVQANVTVRLEYKLPEDRVLVTEPPDTLRVAVKGTRRRTRRFDSGDLPPIVVDLVNHRRSEYVFAPDLVNLPEGLELLRYTPASILTQFEPLVERSLPIDVPRQGNVPAGYVVAGISPNPKNITVSGPKTIVESVDSVKTARVPVTGHVVSFVDEVALVPPHSLVQIVGGETNAEGKVKVDVTIVEEHASRKVAELKVQVHGGPDMSPKALSRVTVEPKTIEVWLRGARLAVDGVDDKALEAFVEVSAADIANGRKKQARIMVTRPAPGVAIEVRPQEVTIQAR